ncbi:MAG: TetR/AcrR family transcriptional regulator [Microthrixaceae bacterium]
MGRPPKTEGETPTRVRILAAGAQLFAEQGFETTTLADIAERCDVSPPALYNHFANKDEVLVEVAKWALFQMRDPVEAALEDPHAVARRYLGPDFAPVRRLLLELHLATYRHERVRELLAAWHVEHANRSAESRGSLAAEKMFYIVLMGLSQLDPLSGVDVDEDEFIEILDRVLDAVFPDL